MGALWLTYGSLVPLLAAFLAISPWIIRNAVQFHKFIPATTNGGYTLALGNNPDFYRDVIEGDVPFPWPGPQLDTWQQRMISESAAQGVRVGATVLYTLTDDPAQRHEAVVTRVAPTVDSLTRTIEVLAAPKSRGRVGRAESFAQAEVLGASGTPAVVVPVSAIQAMDGDTVVIAAEPRGEGMFIEAIPVRVGRRTGVQAELLSGVGVGRVILVGSAAIAKAELLKRRTAGEE